MIFLKKNINVYLKRYTLNIKRTGILLSMYSMDIPTIHVSLYMVDKTLAFVTSCDYIYRLSEMQSADTEYMALMMYVRPYHGHVKNQMWYINDKSGGVIPRCHFLIQIAGLNVLRPERTASGSRPRLTAPPGPTTGILGHVHRVYLILQFSWTPGRKFG